MSNDSVIDMDTSGLVPFTIQTVCAIVLLQKNIEYKSQGALYF